MATLQSPGVQVNVIDESFYTPAAPGTVPLIFVATKTNKTNASGTGIAQGTLQSNAGTVYVITSQRDLTDTFGTPLFYTDTSGNPINGGETNEYGLQAAYSVLGVSSKAYVIRADVDLGQLDAQSDIPVGPPVSGTYWVDTSNSTFGINEWNASTLSFTVKTPIVIDSTNSSEYLVSGQLVPLNSIGQQGNYAIVVTPDNINPLYYKSALNTWVAVATTGSTWASTGKQLAISPHYQYPSFTGSTPSGSVWIKTTSPGMGANWAVKYYNGATESFVSVSTPIYASTRQALEKIDYAGGGATIPAGTIFIESDFNHNSTANFKIWRRNALGPTNVTGIATSTTASASMVFNIRETLASTSTWGTTYTVTVPAWSPSTRLSVAASVPAALSNQPGIQYVTASYNAATNKLTFSHALGGDFELKDVTNAPLLKAGITASSTNLYTAPSADGFDFLGTNWKPLTYEATTDSPTTSPLDGTLWYDSNLSDVDIMVHNGYTWVGYNSTASIYTGTDVNGPIISVLEPMTQSDGSPLADGDIWIGTDDPEMYGKEIYVYSANSGIWVKQDPTDQNSPSGWLFADARWSTNGTDTDPATITSLLVSNYLDPDAPDPALYPRGTHLWNTRRSGFNVKKYVVGHIDTNSKNARYGDESTASYNSDRWVTASSNNEDGSGCFGRFAQRKVVVKALKATVDVNIDARDTDTIIFNLIATPGYTELISNMVGLNTDRGQTALVVGDTPFRLEANSTVLNNWGLNKNLDYDNGDVGAVTYDEYLAMFYPSGLTTDNTGNQIVVPASHMILRTIINSDNVSFPWFAPAGTRRGGVDNATSVGYIQSSTGEFKPTALPEALRNVLYNPSIEINPIATLPGVGIVNFGQRTRAKAASALDRINVVRLVAYLRYQLKILAKPYLFEPNDALTRREIKGAADSLLLELVGQRALNDFITVCDTSNNTPARIDRNELWLDIAIEPVKAVEFIYIPLRILNTGAIASGNLGSLSKGSGA